MGNTMDKRTAVRFAAINQYIHSNIVRPTESRMVGADDMVSWGEGNKYPDYLEDLYKNVPTLKSIIDGTTDYICGDSCHLKVLVGTNGNEIVNEDGETTADLVREIAVDIMTYGGFALHVIRNFGGGIANIYWLPLKKLRSNKKNTLFFYSEDWSKTSRGEMTFSPFRYISSDEWSSLDEIERGRASEGVLFVKMTHSAVYPQPKYSAAVKACEIERCIDDFHLNEINNGFSGTMLVNFNNGIPTDEQMDEIEHNVNAKFSGQENAGRIMCAWNEDRMHAVSVEALKVESFGERYNALADRSRQEIFTAFRANPNLFGIPTEGNGFANEQYEDSFRLYNRTIVRPLQNLIVGAFDRIFGQKDTLEIQPFTM